VRKRKEDIQLFNLVNKKSQKLWKRFEKYYAGDTKLFINKINRDYKEIGKFPLHVLRTIKKIPKEKYHSAVCILRGGLPYSVLFQALGWKIHYVLCGRKNEQHDVLRFNKNVDKSLEKIRGKKILLIENNSPRGKTPGMVADNLAKNFRIKKPDLFLDYYSMPKREATWMREKRIVPFWKNKKILSKFGKVYEAVSERGSKEDIKIIREFVTALRKVK
jgi:hypothetical protein